jgi:hypothetical protein
VEIYLEAGNIVFFLWKGAAIQFDRRSRVFA